MRKRTTCFCILIFVFFFFGKTFALPAPAFALPVNVTGLCFSPDGGCTRLVVDRIDHAGKNIKVMSYSFTSAPISKALVRAKKRGVDVQVVIDSEEARRMPYEVRMLVERGVPVYTDTETGIFHDKVMIIDGDTVITGSMNWTKAGEHANAENLIVLKSRELAGYYLKNFQFHEAKSVSFKGAPVRSSGWNFKKW
ncbi:MAG: phospholipase D family protein [Nitrospiraceae bacterium]|nr:phospholipase D family protein [Nitrospiraceae bacterium]